MELKEMTIEEMEARKSEISEELESPEADLDALKEEVRSINEEMGSRRAAEAAKEEIRAAVAEGAGEVIKTIEKEERKIMNNEEIRNSKAYIEAYAEFIKTGDDKECRALLTENVSGAVPVPEFVEGFIRTNWEKNDILDRIRKTNFKGNLKIAWEQAADGAYWHTEGTDAPTEEDLTLGIYEIVPRMLKKYIKISDESVAVSGDEFLRYIYDELTHQIDKALADAIVRAIMTAPDAVDWTAGDLPAQPTLSIGTPAITDIVNAYALLSDEAENPVIIMPKSVYADYVALQAANGYAFDPFMGLPVIFSNELDDNTEYFIVGDLAAVQANFPEGDGVRIKYDDLSLAELDLVKIVGREYVGIGITAPARFVRAVAD